MSGRDPIPIRGLHHYALTVSSLADAKAWYADVLGLAVSAEWTIAEGAIRIALLKGPGFAVELFETDGPKDNPAQGQGVVTSLATKGLRHVAFTVDDVAATVAALGAKGVKIAAPPAHSDAGFTYCFALDPDGNQLEFVQPD